MDFDCYRQLPIPAWLELSCPRCGYRLQGLPEYRCPECGLQFDIDELLTPADPRRPPEILPTTRPVPELGLVCQECDARLAGAIGDRCPECGEPFDLADYVPDAPWPEIAVGCSDTETRLIYAEFRAAGIPCPSLDKFDNYATGDSPRMMLAVRRDYYLDALHVMHQARKAEFAEWTCPRCGQTVPANFEICWKCTTPRQSVPS